MSAAEFDLDSSPCELLWVLFFSWQWVMRTMRVSSPQKKKAPGLKKPKTLVLSQGEIWVVFPGDEEHFTLSYLHSINRKAEVNVPLAGLFMGPQCCNSWFTRGSVGPWSPSPATSELCIKGRSTDPQWYSWRLYNGDNADPQGLHKVNVKFNNIIYVKVLCKH